MKNRTIAQLIASAMGDHGLTDTEAARRLGVKQPTVTRWRVGKAVPSEERIGALAEFCGVSTSVIRKAISDTAVRQPRQIDGTLGHLLRTLEYERGMEAADAHRQYGIDKSTYYRWRGDRAAPHLTDVPTLAVVLGVSEERLVMAIYRSTLALSR